MTRKLLDLEQRRITRFLVACPPRHGKSELCSQYFPAWYLARHPDHRVVLASFESSLAEKLGSSARDVLKEWGPEVFGLSVDRRKALSHDWRLTGHPLGGMRSLGIHAGGMTGRGIDLLIIDDPIKDGAEAMSSTFKERVWTWYNSTAATRMEPGGVIMIIQTRWTQDDLVGRVLKQQELNRALGLESEPWEQVIMPALIETEADAKVDALHRQVGEALWPWRYDAAALRKIKQDRPAHWWNALYQQRPTPPGGSLAKDVWFKIVGAMPADVPLQRVRFWDCAGSKLVPGADPDWTVGALLARDGNIFYVEDIIRVRDTAGEIDKLIRQTAVLDGPGVAVREEQEPGSSGKAVIASRTLALAGFNYRGIPSHGAKEMRWMPLLVQAEVGNVRMLTDQGRERRWNVPFLAEVSAAPHGDHDDQLDACAGAFAALALESTASLAAGAAFPLYY